MKDDHIQESTPKKEEDASPKKRPGVIGIKGFSDEAPEGDPVSPLKLKKKELQTSALKIKREEVEQPEGDGKELECFDKEF